MTGTGASALADIEAIRQLKARYFRFLDTKDWVGLRSVFIDEAEMDVSADGAGIASGADAIVDGIASALDGVVTVHQGTNPEITVDGDEAAGIWAMTDHLEFPDGTVMRGAGHYEERYLRTDGGWRIAAFRLTRLRRDFSG